MLSPLIRVDWSQQIGLGHLMRCLRLAYHLAKRRIRVPLVLNQSLEDAGLKNPHELIIPHVLNAEDPEHLKRIYSQYKVNTLIVDGYHFTPERLFLDSINRLYVFDDGVGYSLTEKGIVISSINNPNYKNKEVYAGADFVVLNPLIRDFSKKQCKTFESFFSFMGATDAAQMNSILTTLNMPTGTTLKVVAKKCDRLNKGAKNQVIEFSENPYEFFLSQDCALVAAGSITWELAHLGIPQILIKTADSQSSLINYWVKNEAAFFAGVCDDIKSRPELLSELIQRCQHEPEWLTTLSNNSKQLVDGFGIERITSILDESNIWCRPVCWNDCLNTFNLANDMQTRANSFVGKPIDWNEHCDWFKQRLVKSDSPFYIYFNTLNELLGIVRLDYKTSGHYVISVNLSPDQRGRGFGAQLIRRSIMELKLTQKINVVHALVKKENSASIKSFEKAGFVIAGPSKEYGIQALEMVYETTN